MSFCLFDVLNTVISDTYRLAIDTSYKKLPVNVMAGKDVTHTKNNAERNPLKAALASAFINVPNT